MAEERVKCPFCSELIISGALKCRFCGEWFSSEDEAEEKAIENSSPRELYGRAWGTQGREIMIAGGGQEYSVPIRSGREQSEKVTEADDDGKDEAQEAVNESPVRVVSFNPTGDKSHSKHIKKKRRIPWLRIVLVVAYLAIAVALGVSEFNAHEALREGQAMENAKDYNAAFDTYRDVMKAFPFSFALIETRQGLRRICESDEFEMPRPAWLLEIEDRWGSELDAPDIYLLPFAAWPACAALLFLVFVTRILRPVTALIVLLLMIVAIAGTVVQLVRCGLISLTPVAEVAQVLMQASMEVYCASYLLLVLTALMTLTAMRKKRAGEIGKMATATAKKR